MLNTTTIPNIRIIVGMCLAAIAGYALFSIYVVVVLRDATMTGDTVGTWKSFAVLAFGFWLGSSSGSKAKSDPATPTGTPSDPIAVTETQP